MLATQGRMSCASPQFTQPAAQSDDIIEAANGIEQDFSVRWRSRDGQQSASFGFEIEF